MMVAVAVAVNQLQAPDTHIIRVTANLTAGDPSSSKRYPRFCHVQKWSYVGHNQESFFFK